MCRAFMSQATPPGTVQLAIVAAAEGAKAGFAINTALQHSELA
jgi:hypothetical protein